MGPRPPLEGNQKLTHLDPIGYHINYYGDAKLTAQLVLKSEERMVGRGAG